MTRPDRDRPGIGQEAGRVGRAHGLDGSFYVTGALPRLLTLGARVTIGSDATEIVRRAGTDRRPIVRVRGVCDRAAAEALRGQPLTVAAADVPELPEGEWWARELEGCEVFDGERPVGVVTRLIELPSCEALEVRRPSRPREAAGTSRGSAGARHDGSAGREPETEPLLVPMVKDAIRRVDVEARKIDVDMTFLEEA